MQNNFFITYDIHTEDITDPHGWWGGVRLQRGAACGGVAWRVAATRPEYATHGTHNRRSLFGALITGASHAHVFHDHATLPRARLLEAHIAHT